MDASPRQSIDPRAAGIPAHVNFGDETAVIGCRNLPAGVRVVADRGGLRHQAPVGFQNSADASGLRFPAAGSYSLINPPRTGRRRIPRVSGICDRQFWAWRVQLERSMRPPRVVVHRILGEHPAEVPLAEDQHAVGEFGSDGQHEAFGEAVGSRAAGRDLDHVDARILEHRVERGRELTSAIG
jgi:hypothetical protein